MRRRRKLTTGPGAADVVSTEEIASRVFLIVYTDTVFQILVFFVFLTAIAVPDSIRRARVMDSLASTFRGQTQRSISDKQPNPEAIADIARRARFDVETEADRIKISIPSAELFASGDDRIRRKVRPALIAIAKQVVALRLFANIEGHTDSRPINSARFPSNWELSAARAISVLRLFADRGVPLRRMAAAGRGEFRPVASNETTEGRAKNRRVEILLSAEQGMFELTEKDGSTLGKTQAR